MSLNSLPPQNTPLTDLSGTMSSVWYRYMTTLSLTSIEYAGTAGEIQVSISGQVSLADNTTMPGNAAMTVPIGTTGQRPAGSNGNLRYNSTINDMEYYRGGIGWQPVLQSSALTTKGDLLTYSTSVDRLPVGSDNQYLIANSSTSTGLEWKSPNFRLIDVNVVSTSNSSTGSSETLYSLDVPANTLSTAGDFLKIKTCATTAATADSKTIDISLDAFGGSTIASVTDTLNNSTVVFDLTIYRVTAGIQKVIGTVSYDTTTEAIYADSLINLGVDFSVDLSCTVTNVADVTAKAMSVEGVFNV